MNLAAVFLVLASAALHASWNILLKRADNKLPFTALYVSIGPLYISPYLLAQSPWASIDVRGWLCILAAGVIYAAYYESLARAYVRGELSVVYPVARGVGLAFAFVLGIACLSETPTWIGGLGVGLILVGVYLLHRRALRLELHKPGSTTALRVAVFVGFTYSLYSLVDKVGVSNLGIDPLVYIALASFVAAMLLAPRVLWLEGSGTLREEWKRNGRVCMLVAGLNLVSYLIILYALTLPNTPIGYVVPLRATASLIGVFWGVSAMQEGDLGAKLVAAFMMLLGVIAISWKG